MSFKSGLIKLAINLTPKWLVLRIANKLLKDVAEVKYFALDLEQRKSYVEVQLAGEPEPIEVWFEGFAVIQDGDSYGFILPQARSNKLWLANLLSRVTGKVWKIPAPPHLAGHMKLLSELLEAKG